MAFFSELGKLCELTVLFERRYANDRELSWHDFNFENFNGIFLKGINYTSDKALCFEVIKYLSKSEYDCIVVGGYATPTGALAINYMKLKRIPFVLNIDGGFVNKNESQIKKNLKTYLISSAVAWLSTGKASSDYLEYYGANEKRIFIYPFTTLKQTDLLEELIEKNEKIKLREELGIIGDHVVLTVGRFVRGKGFDILIKACLKVPSTTSVYFIGGVPTEEYLEPKESLQLKNVHFLGFKSKDEILKFYRAADLFVLPTREDIWGLVINEAMASGLPVIITDKCVAGLELVKNYENGHIVPVENVDDLSMRINEILENDELRSRMSESSLSKSKRYTLENMALETYKILDMLKKKNIIF